MTHSKLPWKMDGDSVVQIVSDDNKLVCLAQSMMTVSKKEMDRAIFDIEEVPANAELIVRAVNSHDMLVEALERLVDASDGSYYSDNPYLKDEADKARQILTKLTKKKNGK